MKSQGGVGGYGHHRRVLLCLNHSVITIAAAAAAAAEARLCPFMIFWHMSPYLKQERDKTLIAAVLDSR